MSAGQSDAAVLSGRAACLLAPTGGERGDVNVHTLLQPADAAHRCQRCDAPSQHAAQAVRSMQASHPPAHLLPCRDCIGQHFATMEAKLVLASMYRTYTFTYAGPAPEEVVTLTTDKPKYGVPVLVSLRQ